MEPAGRDTAALGPGDNSDSGSDMAGLEGMDTDDPVERHPARRGGAARSARDIGVDRIFTPGRTDEDNDAGAGRMLRDDEDPDLAFVGSGVAGDPVEDEEAEDADDNGERRGLGDEGDNIPGAHSTPHREPVPGPNPAPDRPGKPGLPGEGDDEDLPADDESEPAEKRPGRAMAARDVKTRKA